MMNEETKKQQDGNSSASVEQKVPIPQPLLTPNVLTFSALPVPPPMPDEPLLPSAGRALPAWRETEAQTSP